MHWRTIAPWLAAMLGCAASAVVAQDNALHFDGTDDRVQLPVPAVFADTSTQDFSVSTWLRRDSEGSVPAQRVFFSQQSSATGVTLLLSGVNTLLYVRRDNITVAASGPLPPGAAWSHVTATWQAATSTIALYIDGEAVPVTPGGSTGVDGVMTPAAHSPCATLSMGAGPNQVHIQHVTMADNTLAATPAAGGPWEIYNGPTTAPLVLRSSIIEPKSGVQVLFASNPIDADCVKAPAFSGNGTRALPLPAPYAFVSRASYDYRPAVGNSAIDACDTSQLLDSGLGGADLVRHGSVDDPGVPNRLGPTSLADIGAFEVTVMCRLPSTAYNSRRSVTAYNSSSAAWLCSQKNTTATRLRGLGCKESPTRLSGT